MLIFPNNPPIEPLVKAPTVTIDELPSLSEYFEISEASNFSPNLVLML